jgi:deoxyribonuclease V
MILATDVHYTGTGATAAGVAFNDWPDAQPTRTVVSRIAQGAGYAPGLFYQRELPCLLALLREHDLQPGCIVVDGYVYLDGRQRPGLGWYLFDALRGTVPVVGVAKSAFAGIGAEHEVRRGGSERPLYVTCAGMALDAAKAHVADMHGDHRMPTLLRAVDQLSRGPV